LLPFHLFFFSTWCIFILLVLTVLFLLVCSPLCYYSICLVLGGWSILFLYTYIFLYWINSVFPTGCVLLSLLIRSIFPCLTHWSILSLQNYSFCSYFLVHFIPATLCIVLSYLVHFIFLAWFILFTYLIHFIPVILFTPFLLLNPCKSYVTFSIRFLYLVKFIFIMWSNLFLYSTFCGPCT
jgi:hypothetical protein